jgi:hypothetical protein
VHQHTTVLLSKEATAVCGRRRRRAPPPGGPQRGGGREGLAPPVEDMDHPHRMLSPTASLLAMVTATPALAPLPAPPPALPFSADIPWASFLAAADPVWSWNISSSAQRLAWNAVPSIYWQGAFVGNGNFGATVTVQAPTSAGAARGGGGPRVGAPVLTLGRTDTYERRSPPSLLSTGEIFCDEGRLPIGNLTLKTQRAVLSGTMRLSLYHAEVSGELLTLGGGRITFRLQVLATGDDDALLIEMNTSESEATSRWEFHPLSANASRPVPSFGLSESFPCRSKLYKPNPKVITRPVAKDGTRVWTQPLLVGMQYSTTLALNASDGGRRQLVSLTTGAPSASEDLAASAKRMVALLRSSPRAAAIAAHRAAWAGYYSLSFLSISHPKLEQFYWIHTYRLGIMMGFSGDDAPPPAYGVPDHTGLLFSPSNGLFNWDQNLQNQYISLFGANRGGLARGLLLLLEDRLPSLVANVPPAMRDGNRTLAGAQGHTGYSLLQDPHWHHANKSCVVPATNEPTCFVKPPSFLGDLVWVMWLLWQDFTHTRDMGRLPRLYPLLSGAATFCAKHMERGPGPDDLFHMPPTWSPEYFFGPGGGDTTYELALCKFGMRASLDAAALLNISATDDDRLPLFEERLAAFPPYATDARGLMVARGISFKVSHSATSHLTPIMFDTAGVAAPLLERSLDNWEYAARPWTRPWAGVETIHDFCGSTQHAAASTLINCTWNGKDHSLQVGCECERNDDRCEAHYCLAGANEAEGSACCGAGFELYSYGWSTVFNVLAGRANAALRNITYPIEHANLTALPLYVNPVEPLQSQIQANAQYTDGPADPTGEGPVVLMHGLQTMLLSSFNGSMHVFRGWNGGGDAAFHQMRAVGGFLVSANFSNGETLFVRVLNQAGAETHCNVSATSLKRPIAVLPVDVPMSVDDATGVVSLSLAKGQVVVLYHSKVAEAPQNASFVVKPVVQPLGTSNIWGLRTA